jgi:hypothetical protein
MHGAYTRGLEVVVVQFCVVLLTLLLLSSVLVTRVVAVSGDSAPYNTWVCNDDLTFCFLPIVIL